MTLRIKVTNEDAPPPHPAGRSAVITTLNRADGSRGLVRTLKPGGHLEIWIDSAEGFEVVEEILRPSHPPPSPEDKATYVSHGYKAEDYEDFKAEEAKSDAGKG